MRLYVTQIQQLHYTALSQLRGPPSGGSATSTRFPDQLCTVKFNLIHKGQTSDSIRSNQLM